MFQKPDKEVNRFNGTIFGHQLISQIIKLCKEYSRKIKKFTRMIMRIKLTRREERTKRWRLEAKVRTREAIAAVRTLKDILSEI